MLPILSFSSPMACRIRSGSPPGSTTTPSPVASSHQREQFCWKGVTGMITAFSPMGLFPARQVEARQLVRIGLEVQLAGEAVGRDISMQRQPEGVLRCPLDGGAVGLLARFRIGAAAAFQHQLLHLRITDEVVVPATEED